MGDLAVAEQDCALGLPGDVCFVGHHDNGHTGLVELFQQAGIEWHSAPSKATRFFATLANS